MSASDVISLPLPDDPARGRIVEDLDTNLFVEAGAGSGKTTELVRRMVALVGSDAAKVEEIAAVTFTRKAAGELRQRFQGALEEALRARRADGARGEDDGESRLSRALQDIDRCFIGTIHAFCARLLRERPLEAGLDPAFEELPVEERAILRRRFWDAYLERLVRDQAPLLEALGDVGLSPTKVRGLFERMADNLDVAFPAGEAEAPRPEEAEGVRAALEAIVDAGMAIMPDREPAPSWDSLQKKIRSLAFTRELNGWREPADLFGAIEVLCRPEGSSHRITQKRWMDGGAAKALAERAEAFGVGDTEAHRLVRRWHAHRYALAVRLASRAVEEFAAHRLRLGKLDFEDLLVLAARLLRVDPRVRRDLGARYRRLLVDEFQDTDPLQAEIVLLLASEPDDDGAPEADWRGVVPRPGALFVVGDPKQSIYRFRRADIQLYAQVKERFRAFGDVLELTTNFRSRPPIGDLVNQLFDRPDFFPPEATPEQAAFEPLNTRPPPEPGASGGVFWYAVDPDATNAPAVARDDASRLGAWIASRVRSGERSAGDFLILTWRKKNLDAYARALEAWSLPIQVSGASVGLDEELRELLTLLECMVDPANPVKVLAVLVGLFFGIDYERLVDHRLRGGSLDVVRPGEEGDPDVVRALGRLHGWWRRSAAEPADVFVERITVELGLLPLAAGGELGTIRAGALVYALDAVRGAALAGDASIPGALEAVRAAFDDVPEAEAPLEPGREDVVRLMNLHQAKGLEAPVVVLADPSRTSVQEPDLHVERTGEGAARGYAPVTDPGERFASRTPLAVPAEWERLAERERGFDAAEQVRLLYVAVTRAREELVVSRWPDKAEASAWSPLDPWLDDHAHRLELEPAEPSPRETLAVSPGSLEERRREAAKAIEEMAEPTFVHRSVTEVAKGAEPEHDAPESTAEPADVPEPDAGAFRGYSWGTAVHGALALAAEDPSPERLAAGCRQLLAEAGRPLDAEGAPLELDELLALVRAVLSSELWERAGGASRLLTEVPFAWPIEGGADGGPPEAPAAPEGAGGRTEGGRPQLELFGGGGGRGAPGRTTPAASRAGVDVLEGVIDLAFREDDGWVIADYKTDVGTDPDFPRRRTAYRRQVDLYAEAWRGLTGEPVKERVLFFTTQGRVEAW